MLLLPSRLALALAGLWLLLVVGASVLGAAAELWLYPGALLLAALATDGVLLVRAPQPVLERRFAATMAAGRTGWPLRQPATANHRLSSSSMPA